MPWYQWTVMEITKILYYTIHVMYSVHIKYINKKIKKIKKQISKSEKKLQTLRTKWYHYCKFQ